MSLSGNLGFVSLDEVLRLITRSQQAGAVEVKGDRVTGRIYVGRSGIDLATTFSNDTLSSHLSRSGLLSTDQVRQASTGGSLSDDPRLIALLREMSVEGLYQMGVHGSTFEVFQDETTPFGSPQPFDLEDILADARKRRGEWEEVNAIVSDLDREVRLQRDLGDRDQITLNKDSWRVVSTIGHGASIRELSEQIGTTEFWTARVAAGLVEEDLMALDAAEASSFELNAPAAAEVPVATLESAPKASEEVVEGSDLEIDSDVPDAAVEETDIDPTEDGSGAHLAPTLEVEEASVSDVEPVASEEEPEFAQEAPSEFAAPSTDQPSDSEPVVDPNQSWWKEPETHSDEVVESVFAEAPAVLATSEVEEDTESFLEKVFSELEPAAESDEGYGLLRRRRMGAIRDNTPNS